MTFLSVYGPADCCTSDEAHPSQDPSDGENLCRLEIFRYPGLFFGFIVQNWFLPVHRNEFSPGRLHFPHLFPLPPTQLLSLFPIFNVNFSSWFIDLIDHVWPWKLSALFQRLDVRNFQFGPLAIGEQGLFPVVVVAQVVERHHSGSEGRLRIPERAFRSALLGIYSCWLSQITFTTCKIELCIILLLSYFLSTIISHCKFLSL